MTESALLDAIRAPGGLRTVFQPIVRLAGGGGVFAFESLTRGPRGSNLEAAPALFEYVRRKHQEVAVDRLCIASALAAAGVLPKACRLAVNVHATSLARDAALVEFLATELSRREVPAERLIIEIIEQGASVTVSAMLATLERLRKLGIEIALDDVGLGNSNFQMILDCQPDLFKVDRHIVKGVGRDPRRLIVLESIVQVARRLGARVVGEGVESTGELEVLRCLGVDYAQGFLVAAPQPAARFADALCEPANEPSRAAFNERT